MIIALTSLLLVQSTIIIQTIKDAHGMKSYKVLQGSFNRHKISKRQDLKLFPHKTEMAFCPYFALALYLVVDDDPHSVHLFHFFADRVFNETGDVESKVAREWRKEFKDIVLDQMEDYVTRFGDKSSCLKNASITSLNQSLTSHCGRKYTMNELANMFSVMPHMICFRVGMLMNNIHSFFDYVTGSEKMDINVGKNISAWDDVLDGNVFGGYPPVCSDITTEAEKVEVFVHNLYGHQKQLDNDVKDILAATILRFYHEFTVLLSNQPDGKFSGDNIFHNQFCYAVTSAKENAGVSDDTFIAWQAEVCAGFTSRNQYSLSGDWIDEPELGIKPFAKTIAN